MEVGENEQMFIFTLYYVWSVALHKILVYCSLNTH